jgi:Tfp pilus assembly protein PilX
VEGNRGVALILALLALSFLTVLGGALLTNATVDVWISDNYKRSIQSLYLAEAGIDDARELLRRSGRSASEALSLCAGPDARLMTSDDAPLIPTRTLGDAGGTYQVWLRNDSVDGAASATDTNEVLELISMAQVGKSRKTIQSVIEKGRFPESDMDARLYTITGLEGLVRSITRIAAEIEGAAMAADSGAPEDYRVVVANGNLDLGPGTGYGILLVRGELNIVGDVTWNGLVLVIGQGVVRLAPGASTAINGGLFAARTRGVDGLLLGAPEAVSYTITDAAQIRTANQPLPYSSVSFWER